MATQFVSYTIFFKGIGMGRSLGAKRWLARGFRIVALINLGVGISQLDGNITFQLILKTDGLHTTNSLDNSRFSVSDVPNGADVNSSLTRYLGIIRFR